MAQNAALQAQAASNGVLFEQRFSVAEPIVQMTGVEPDLALTGSQRGASLEEGRNLICATVNENAAQVVLAKGDEGEFYETAGGLRSHSLREHCPDQAVGVSKDCHRWSRRSQ